MTNKLAFPVAILAGLSIGLFMPTGLADKVAPSPAPPVTTTQIEEDHPDWNCMTMGNLTCGSGWEPLTDDIADAVAEGVDDPASIPTSRDDCMMRVADEVTIVCSDGRVIH